MHLYSIDTGYFYTEREERVNRSLDVRYFYRAKLKKSASKINNRITQLNNLIDAGDSESQQKMHSYSSHYAMEKQLKRIYCELAIVDNEIREMKKELRHLQDTEEEQRTLKMSKLKDRDVVSVFSSSLTRAMELETGTLTRDIIIVKTFYFKVLEDIIKDGFKLGKDTYVPFTASAGQIRTKKTVFIKKSVFEKIKPKLMCGLSPERINENGGINVNKYLAYLALSNSATELWRTFDINKSIVVEDMETMVEGTVDFIDYNDYSITRQDMEVPIPHTDGCGMVLPKIGEDKTDIKAMMIRMPWMKGLIVPFPFDKFIRQHNRGKSKPEDRIGKITDIYGKEYDILEDEIEVIFTKSQFKMWKYYDSWQEYIDFFHKYGCEAGYCNEEPDIFGNAKLNYQMLQTLTDITEEEIKQLSSKTAYNIKQMGRDRDIMLGALGVVEHNTRKNDYQKALELYPELLQDTYGRQTVRATKKSMVKKARAARLDLNAMYTFLIPDLYAVCEYMFQGIEHPRGLLADGEVSCQLYKNEKEVDVLRSPHLYREHAVRTNVVNRDIKKWFVSNGIYTSSHDLISKMLQFDK